MLDCGNNTYDQFLLHYSPDVLNDKLKALKVVFITHLHADHTLGILDLICKRNKLIEQNKK
jgi:ribonuclease Z